MALLARLGSWLVEPAPGGPAARTVADAPEARSAAPAAELAVLAAAGDVHALAAAMALRLTRGTGVVGLWTGSEASPTVRTTVPPTPASRRLARSLAARDLPARASGRLVTSVLPRAEADAAAAAARLAGAVVDAPIVLAVGGPRGAAWDGVLVACDLVAVHAPDDALAELTVTRLAEQGARPVRIDGVPAPAGRLARAGLALPGTLDGVAAAAGAVARC